MNNKVLLYSTGNYIQCLGINHNEEYKKNVCVHIYIYVSMYNCACTVEINTTLQINYISIFLKTEKAYRIKDKNKYGEIVIGKFT